MSSTRSLMDFIKKALKEDRLLTSTYYAKDVHNFLLSAEDSVIYVNIYWKKDYIKFIKALKETLRILKENPETPYLVTIQPYKTRCLLLLRCKDKDFIIRIDRKGLKDP